MTIKNDPLADASQDVDRRGALIIGLIVVAALGLLFLKYPVPVALIAGIFLMVMAHEAGHFLAAKRAGMKATEFFVGFGPRIWSFTRGETEYGIKAIPAGGYVKIIGMTNLEEVDPADEPRTYRAAPFGWRLTVVLAGVTVNILLALVLFFAAFLGKGVAEGPSTTIDEIVADSPAEAAGLRPGDTIVAIDGAAVEGWDDLPDAIEERAGEPTIFAVERGGELVEIEAMPEARSESDDSGFLGVAPTTDFDRLSIPVAAKESLLTPLRATRATGDAMVDFFSASGLEQHADRVSGQTPTSGTTDGGGGEGLTSIVGAVDQGSDVIDDVWTLFFVLGLINFALALFNLLPLVPLDGGHAAVALFEGVATKVRGREVRVDFARLMPVAALVTVLILFLGLSLIYVDILRIARS